MRKTFTSIVLPFICLSSFNPAIAQPFVDVLNFSYRPFTKATYPDYSGYSTKSDQLTGNLFVPVPLKNKDVVFGGIDYLRLNFDFRNADTTEKTSFTAANLEMGYIRSWKGGKWNTMLMLLPKLSSDFKAGDGKNFQMGGAVLFTYKVRNSLKYKFGLYYNREFFGNFFMPLLGIDWKVNPRMFVFGVLPGALNLEYKLREGLYTGLSYRCITASYRVTGISGDYYAREGEKFWGDNLLYGFLQCYPIKNIVVSASAGTTLFRYFQLYKGKNKAVHPEYQVYAVMRDQFFIDLGIAFRVRMEKEYDD